MFVRTSIGCLLAASGFALGQSQSLVFTQDNNEPLGFEQGLIAMAPSVGVGQNAIAVAANRRMALYTRGSVLLDLRALNDPDFPFVKGLHPAHPFEFTNIYDPSTNHDPIGNRLWVVYTEGEVSPVKFLQQCGPVVRLHIGVNKDPSEFPTPGGPLDTFDDTHWHYYTGDGVPPTTKAGPYFELQFPGPSPFISYKDEGDLVHLPPTSSMRLPDIGFDEQAVVLSLNDPSAGCESPGNGVFGAELHNQYLFIIPRTHDVGASSILDGDKPADGDITLIRMGSPQVTFPVGRLGDLSDFYRIAHEPFPEQGEQVPNTMLFVNVIDRNAEIQKDLRIRGLYDADPGPGVDWTLQQQTTAPPATIELLDMPLPAELHFTNPTLSRLDSLLPRTPDSTWRPDAVGAIMESALLVRDSMDRHRVFALHAVHPATQVMGGKTTKVNKWVVELFVFVPNLANFGTGVVGGWQPVVEAAGRIEFEDGDAYHPVIVVNRQGMAFIEYTFSDVQTYPQIRRVRLNSDYTATVAGSDAIVRSGPPIPYVPGSFILERFWADYADAQADPFNMCAYWSTHTLAFEPPNQDPPLLETEKRNVWLFHQPFFNSTPFCLMTQGLLDLNDDEAVDTLDMATLTDLYTRSARRIDLNADGVTDRHDLDLYMAAYDEYTRR